MRFWEEEQYLYLSYEDQLVDIWVMDVDWE
jgi:hypothetical protein